MMMQLKYKKKTGKLGKTIDEDKKNVSKEIRKVRKYIENKIENMNSRRNNIRVEWT